MNKTWYLIFSGLIAGASLISCGSNSNKKIPAKEIFEKGKIINSVVCKNDNTQSYALYLPSCYSDSNPLPVIFGFDSHGDGIMPVKLFQDYAEKYGYILVGSHNSKNGLPWQTTSVIYDTLYNDVLNRFSVNQKCIYTAGFSGGSRVASSVALMIGGIKGVIGCGAGFPNLNQPISNKFDYIGFAGNEDFNLIEMKNLDKSLAQSGMRHQLVVFNGKHEWPPKNIIADAFLWIEMNAMKDKLKSRNDTLISNTLSRWDGLLQALKKQNNTVEVYLLTRKIIAYFNELCDVKKYKDELASLEKTPAMLAVFNNWKLQEQHEAEQQAYYADAITSQNLSWWKIQVSQMNAKINASPKSENALELKRLLSYLSLATYMNVSGAMKANQISAAENLNAIYELVEPLNPEWAYLQASLEAKKGENEKVFPFLEKAVELGFADIDRLQQDATFDAVKTDQRFNDIISKIQSKKTK